MASRPGRPPIVVKSAARVARHVVRSSCGAGRILLEYENAGLGVELGWNGGLSVQPASRTRAGGFATTATAALPQASTGTWDP